MNTILILSILVCIFSILTILVSNPVHSIIYLIFSFVFSSFILFIMNVEFLAFIILIVYVGAIAILFLFIIMMLNIKMVEPPYFSPSPYLAGFVFHFFVVFVLPIVVLRYYNFLAPSLLNSDLEYILHYTVWLDLLDNYTNIQLLGQLLYTHYFVIFLISGFVLLVAMIGSIVLTLYHRTNTKRQSIYYQLSQSYNKSIIFKK